MMLSAAVSPLLVIVIIHKRRLESNSGRAFVTNMESDIPRPSPVYYCVKPPKTVTVVNGTAIHRGVLVVTRLHSIREWTGQSLSSMLHCCTLQTTETDGQPSQHRRLLEYSNDARRHGEFRKLVVVNSHKWSLVWVQPKYPQTRKPHAGLGLWNITHNPTLARKPANVTSAHGVWQQTYQYYSSDWLINWSNSVLHKTLIQFLKIALKAPRIKNTLNMPQKAICTTTYKIIIPHNLQHNSLETLAEYNSKYHWSTRHRKCKENNVAKRAKLSNETNLHTRMPNISRLRAECKLWHCLTFWMQVHSFPPRKSL